MIACIYMIHGLLNVPWPNHGRMMDSLMRAGAIFWRKTRRQMNWRRTRLRGVIASDIILAAG